MKLEVNIEKRHLYFFIGFIVLVMGVMIVVAFGTSSPSTFGHSAEEVGAGTINNTLTILQSGKVGIGTTTPTTRLEVNGSVNVFNQSNAINSFFFVNGTTGNVGIGTTNPGVSSSNGGKLVVASSGGYNGVSLGGYDVSVGGLRSDFISFAGVGHIQTYSAPLYLNPRGNNVYVGVTATAPSNLVVTGDIKASGAVRARGDLSVCIFKTNPTGIGCSDSFYQKFGGQVNIGGSIGYIGICCV